jgi:hypothetical protein
VGDVPYVPFAAAWADAAHLAVSSGAFTGNVAESVSKVSLLDLAGDTQRDVIAGPAGATGGVAFDAAGGLLTGNGFASGAGVTATGEIKRFAAADWMAAFATDTPISFESLAHPVFVDLLSAQGLEVDSEGNLVAAGGDFDAFDANSAAIYRPSDALRRDFDPSGDFNFFTTVLNEATGEIYLYDAFSSTPNTVWVVAPVPEPAGVVLMAVCLLAVGALRRAVGRARRV